MPLRDDHQAAIARADALQRQLDEERARGATGTEAVKRLASELAGTRSRLRRAEAELSDLRPALPPVAPPCAKPRPAWMDDLEEEHRPMVMNAAGGLVATGALIFLLLIITSC